MARAKRAKTKTRLCWKRPHHVQASPSELLRQSSSDSRTHHRPVENISRSDSVTKKSRFFLLHSSGGEARKRAKQNRCPCEKAVLRIAALGSHQPRATTLQVRLPQIALLVEPLAPSLDLTTHVQAIPISASSGDATTFQKDIQG